LKIQKVKIANLKSHPKNPNQHPQKQLGELQSSLKEFDQVKNIVVWKGFVIAGNGLLIAAEKQGRDEIEIQDVSDWSEEKAIKFMIADNRLPELGIMNDETLAEMLKGFDDPLDIPGIDEKFLDELMGNIPIETLSSGESDNDNIVIRLEIISKTWAEHSDGILESIQTMQSNHKGFSFQVNE